VGTVTVDGAGSTYTSVSQISVGWAGTGTLEISTGGLVNANAGMDVAVLTGSTGTVNVNGGGTLATTFLAAGCDPVRLGGLQGCTSPQIGTAQVKFNGATTLRALANNLGFITGFSGNELNIGSGVLTIDTQSFTVGTDTTSAFTGVGGLTKIGSGTLILDGPNTYSGTTTVADGTLAASGVNVFSPNSPTVVESGGTLALQSFNQTLTSLSNAGTVQLPASPGVSAPVTTLTVNGSYVGNNGTLVLNTFLGADNAPSDKLVAGSTSGSTSIFIHNVGGPGLQTTANGIMVVQAASTTPNAFTLDNPELRAGAFDYRLFQGGLNGSDPNDWFLRSTLLGPPAPPPIPIIGPELATYGVVQPIARQMGLTTLGTLHERVGDPAADAACLSAASTGCCAAPHGAAITKAPPVLDGSCQPVVWGRLFGQQINNHYEAFADPRATGRVAGIQTGVDVWRGSLIPGHSETAGLYFAYGNGNVGVDGLVTNPAATANVLEHTGSLNLNAYSLGGYWTHYGPGGWYIDAVVQGSFYNGNAATQFANLPTNGTGFTSSLEAGYPIPLPWFGPRFVLEPEGQIIWQQVSFQDANDGLGPVGLGTTSGATGRLGLRGKWTITDAAGRLWQPYVLANLWGDWGAEATTLFGIDPVPLSEHATRAEFAGGVSAKLGLGISLFAQASYQFALDKVFIRNGIQGDIGLRYAW
jgi:outer membrane autotransporter protein